MIREIIRTNNFLKQLKKIDTILMSRVEKLIIKILTNPEIGKPMRYDLKGTREVYLPPFRLTYAYEKNTDVLIFLDLYYKNRQ